MPKLDYRNIEKDPARCGGQAVVSGTRICVATVLVCYRHGMSVEEILQQYPTLTPSDVHDALAYVVRTSGGDRSRLVGGYLRTRPSGARVMDRRDK